MSDSLGSFLNYGAIARLDSTTIKAKFIEQVEHFRRPKSYANMLRSTWIARSGDNSLKFLTPVRHRHKKYARMCVCVRGIVFVSYANEAMREQQSTQHNLKLKFDSPKIATMWSVYNEL